MPTMDSYPAQTTPNDSDYHVVNDGVSGETKKITRDDYLQGAPLPANTVTSSAIDQNAVQADDLATNAITLGYTQITANPSNFSSTSPVQLTGLSSSVTIPAGGRRVKITAFIPLIQSGASLLCGISLWDGTVGSGTKISEQDYTIPSGAYAGYNVIAVVSPTAGAKTYNVGIAVSTNAVTVNAAAGYPAFILVEAI